MNEYELEQMFQKEIMEAKSQETLEVIHKKYMGSQGILPEMRKKNKNQKNAELKEAYEQLKRKYIIYFEMQKFIISKGFSVNREYINAYYNLHQNMEYTTSKFYRLYALNRNGMYENMPRFGEVFAEIWQVYSYIYEHDLSNYEKINIIEYDRKQKQDKLYDTIVNHNFLKRTKS